MAKIYTYVPSKNGKGGSIDTSNLATKNELREGIQEAKKYTDDVVNSINPGGENIHDHANKPVLDKFYTLDNDLFFNGEKLTGVDVVFETVEG